MNTPTHALLNLALLGGRGGRARFAPVLAGAVLPDLPMLGFWLWQTLALGRAQSLIWTRVYFEAPWQTLFDVFNAIPVYAALALVAAWRRWRAGLWLAASALLHIICDLPLHREDAHAHFWPLSGWHFVSPVSYWDRAHYGFAFSVLELVLLAGSAWWIARRRRGPWTRRALAATVLGCAVAWGLVSFWVDV